MSINKVRRIVLVIILVAFILQFFKFKIFAGSLSGSVAVWSVSLIDIFAFFETLTASKDIAIQALIALVPIVLIYLIVGRAFCGWACPMDLLFDLVNKISALKISAIKMPIWIKANIGYVLIIGFLALSAVVSIPVFTNYISHLTNFFRFFTSLFASLNALPVDKDIVIFSGAMILTLVVLELFFHRMWCKYLCPIGKVYGLFNKVSLLRLSFNQNPCKDCYQCEQVCPMDVKIVQNLNQGSLRDTNCIFCGKCVEGCSTTKGDLIRLKFKKG